MRRTAIIFCCHHEHDDVATPYTEATICYSVVLTYKSFVYSYVFLFICVYISLYLREAIVYSILIYRYIGIGSTLKSFVYILLIFCENQIKFTVENKHKHTDSNF